MSFSTTSEFDHGGQSSSSLVVARSGQPEGRPVSLPSTALAHPFDPERRRKDDDEQRVVFSQ
jgi:hypothetical protein